MAKDQSWDGARAPNPGIYQVWHAKEGAPGNYQFPGDYEHIADVYTDGVCDALNNVQSKPLDGGAWNEWLEARDTTIGDVIVDPQGRPYRVEERSLRQIPHYERPDWQTIAEVAEEERAGRAEDHDKMEREYYQR